MGQGWGVEVFRGHLVVGTRTNGGEVSYGNIHR